MKQKLREKFAFRVVLIRSIPTWRCFRSLDSFTDEQSSIFVILNEIGASPFLKRFSRGLRFAKGDLVIMGGEEGLGVTTGQPNLYKQDLSKLVSNKYTNVPLQFNKLSYMSRITSHITNIL